MVLRKILIVDDNELNRDMLRRALRDEYLVTEAESGKAALEKLREDPKGISAVLLDLIMPEMDGFQVLKEIRRGDTAHIPVIVLTADTEKESEIKALALGASDFVTKPYNFDVVRHRLRNAISFRETGEAMSATRLDHLTGLLNWSAFFEDAEIMIMTKAPEYYTIAYFNVNNFKVINDQYGTKKGDEIIRLIGDTLYSAVAPEGGLCCRITADNFAALYPTSFLDSERFGLMQAAIERLDGSLHPISFSMGYYVIDDLSLPVSAMYDRAIMAEESIKGRYDVHTAKYDKAMRDSILHEQKVVVEMNEALQSGQFEPWFQPQYNHATGALIGAETLVRWQHSSLGILIPPGDFIPVFERNGFIYEMDKYIWERACFYLRKWISEGRKPLPISVNISRHDVFHDDFFSTITGLVVKYGIPVDLLRLEITESAFAESAKQIVDMVKRLIKFGFVVEIDDFGSGYSSLNTLKDVPADVLKLDMRFIEDTDNLKRGGNIVESVVRMAKWLGMTVVAEGVETKAQADFLASIGCCYVQGYYYAKPMPLSDYEKLMDTTKGEERLLNLETVEAFNNSAFWNPESMDTLIFNSYVGGACIFEYHNKKAEILRANRKYAQELSDGGELSVEEAIRINWANHLDSDNKRIFGEAMDIAIQTGDEVSYEMVMLDLPGCHRETYLHATVRVIASVGERYLVYCTNENITKQRLAEQKERETAKQMRAIMDNVNGGVTAVTVSESKVKIIFANEKYFSMLGYTRKQFEAEVENPLDIVHPEDRERVVQAVNRVSSNEVPADFEYRVKKRNGEYIHIRCSASVTHMAGIEGGVMLSVITDITELVKTQRENGRIAQRLQLIMDDADCGITAAAVRDSGQVNKVFINDRYYELLGYTRRQFQNEVEDVFSLIHQDDREWVMQCVREVNQTGKPAKFEFRAKRRDGREIWLRDAISLTRLEDVDIPVQLSMFSDITAEHEAVEKLHRTDEQLTFLNTMAHELLAEPDVGSSIMRVLKKLLDYFNGDRAYIFEFDNEERTANNTYEVCTPGVTRELERLQNIPLETLDFWLHVFDQKKDVSIENVELLDDSRTAEREVLRAQNISSLFAVPLRRDGELVGFMGIDNPRLRHYQMDRLDAVGDYITVMLTRRDLTLAEAVFER